MTFHHIDSPFQVKFMIRKKRRI